MVHEGEVVWACLVEAKAQPPRKFKKVDVTLAAAQAKALLETPPTRPGLIRPLKRLKSWASKAGSILAKAFDNPAISEFGHLP